MIPKLSQRVDNLCVNCLLSKKPSSLKNNLMFLLILTFSIILNILLHLLSLAELACVQTISYISLRLKPLADAATRGVL